MRISISNLDEKNVFCKADEKHGLIILFQRPSYASDSKCNVYFQDICNLLASQGANFASDLVKYTDWSNNIKEVIGASLYVRSFDDRFEPIRGSAVSERFNTISLNHLEGAVAKIIIKNNPILRYLLFAVIMFAIVGGIVLLMNINENNRIAKNQESYNNDITEIANLKKTLNETTKPGSLYAENIPQESLIRITKSLDSLSTAANKNFQSVKNDGKYNGVDILTVRKLMDCTFNNAKKQYSNAEEEARTLDNKSLYDRDLLSINNYNKRLQGVMSKYRIASNTRTRTIQDMLRSLKSEADTNYYLVKKSGRYTPVNINDAQIESLIQKLVPESDSPQEASFSSQDKRFNKLVKTADDNYMSFCYHNYDTAAAKRAIQGYNEALRIKNDVGVKKRLDYLLKKLQSK